MDCIHHDSVKWQENCIYIFDWKCWTVTQLTLLTLSQFSTSNRNSVIHVCVVSQSPKIRATSSVLGNQHSFLHQPTAAFSKMNYSTWRHGWLITFCSFSWDVNTSPCPNFKWGLAKPPLKLWHGTVITSRWSFWVRVQPIRDDVAI